MLPKFPAEALARIIDPEYGMISPDIFIPAAESKGFIIPFGDIVLDQVFKFISQHDNDGLGLSYIEINLSVAQCMEKKDVQETTVLQICIPVIFIYMRHSAEKKGYIFHRRFLPRIKPGFKYRHSP